MPVLPLTYWMFSPYECLSLNAILSASFKLFSHLVGEHLGIERLQKHANQHTMDMSIHSTVQSYLLCFYWMDSITSIPCHLQSNTIRCHELKRSPWDIGGDATKIWSIFYRVFNFCQSVACFWDEGESVKQTTGIYLFFITQDYFFILKLSTNVRLNCFHTTKA